MIDPIPLEQAWERLLGPIAPLPVETVTVNDAFGRYLAESLVARRTQPYAALSAMDGFACAGQGPWAARGESRAGSAYDGSLGDGHAIRISTGAALPEGADRILPVEEAQLDDGRLSATSPPSPGDHVRRRGFDFHLGDHLIDAGSRLNPATLALARSAGYGEVAVHRRTRVAVIECGDELVADPTTCPPDRLPASNGAMLAAMAHDAGAIVSQFGPVADRSEALRAAFENAAGADVIVTSGGASVGAHDLVRPVLDSMGARIDFWRVAVRPGKPLLVARLDGALILGLPGNPVSSFVTGYLFMLPVIRRLAGATHPLPRAIPIALRSDLPEGGLRREFRRGRLVVGRVEPVAERDSSALRALAGADLLIDRPAFAPAAPTGTVVPCYWLGNG